MENQTSQQSSEEVYTKPVKESEENEDLEEQELNQNDEADKYHSGL